MRGLRILWQVPACHVVPFFLRSKPRSGITFGDGSELEFSGFSHLKRWRPHIIRPLTGYDLTGLAVRARRWQSSLDMLKCYDHEGCPKGHCKLPALTNIRAEAGFNVRNSRHYDAILGPQGNEKHGKAQGYAQRRHEGREHMKLFEKRRYRDQARVKAKIKVVDLADWTFQKRASETEALAQSDAASNE